MTDQDNDRIEQLIKRFDEFVEQYEIDMRGDKKVDNGNSGIVGNFREFQRRLQSHIDDHTKYPSITWLLAHKPLPTIITILTVYVFLGALYTFGLLRVFAGMVGVTIP